MPIRQRDKKWYWGSQGPFPSRKKAEKVAQAAHASGYIEKLFNFTKAPPEGVEGISGIGDTSSDRPKDDVPEDFREYASLDEIKRLGLRPHRGVDKGTYYDSRDLEAGQYAASSPDKHTIAELQEAGEKGSITLDDLGIKHEDSGLAQFFEYSSDMHLGMDRGSLNFERKILNTIAGGRAVKVPGLGIGKTYDPETPRGIADRIHENKHPMASIHVAHTKAGKLDASKHKEYGDWLREAQDKKNYKFMGTSPWVLPRTPDRGSREEWGLRTRRPSSQFRFNHEKKGQLHNEMKKHLGRDIARSESMYDLAGELRQNSERIITKAQHELKKLDRLGNEIKAFKIQRGIDRIGLKRGEKEAEKSLDYISKLLDFTILSKAPPEEGQLEPISGIGSSPTEGEDYPGKDVKTRKYIKSKEDAPKGVTVYTGPRVGLFYDFTQVDEEANPDHLDKLFEETLEDIRDLVQRHPEVVEDDLKYESKQLQDQISAIEDGMISRTNQNIRRNPNFQDMHPSEVPENIWHGIYINQEVKALRDTNLQELRDKLDKVKVDFLEGVYPNVFDKSEEAHAPYEEYERYKETLLGLDLHAYKKGLEYNGESLKVDPDVQLLMGNKVYHEYMKQEILNDLQLQNSEQFNELIKPSDEYDLQEQWAKLMNIAKDKDNDAYTVDQIHGLYVYNTGTAAFYTRQPMLGHENVIVVSPHAVDEIFKPQGGLEALLQGSPEGRQMFRDNQNKHITNLRNVLIHEAIHSHYENQEKKDNLYDIFMSRSIRRGGGAAGYGLEGKSSPQIGVLAYQNVRYFFIEYPTELLAQSIKYQKHYPDAKPNFGQDEGFGHETPIGYSDEHGGIAAFGAWAEGYIKATLGTRNEAKIAEGVRALCKELIEHPKELSNRRNILSESWGNFAERYAQKFKLDTDWHIGIRPKNSILMGWAVQGIKIPKIAVRASQAPGSDGRLNMASLRRVVLL